MKETKNVSFLPEVLSGGTCLAQLSQFGLPHYV
jgi:hypothetical protein